MDCLAAARQFEIRNGQCEIEEAKMEGMRRKSGKREMNSAARGHKRLKVGRAMDVVTVNSGRICAFCAFLRLNPLLPIGHDLAVRFFQADRDVLGCPWGQALNVDLGEEERRGRDY